MSDLPAPTSGSDPSRQLFRGAARSKFLESLEATGRLGESAEAAGFGLDCVRRHRRDDPDFEAAVQDAMAMFREAIEREIHRRAIEGVEEPVYQGGSQVGTIVSYSDQLLIKYAQRHIPEYRDRATVDHRVGGGVLVVPLPARDSDEWIERHGGDVPDPSASIKGLPSGDRVVGSGPGGS